MSPRIVCSPCLGQTSMVSGDTAQIIVLLSPHSENQCSSEVVVWHDNSATREWNELNLKEETNEVQILSGNLEKSIRRKCFRGTLLNSARKNVTRFTIKYRYGAREWSWANDESSMGDAEIIFSHEDPIPESLSYYFQDFPSENENLYSSVINLGSTTTQDTRVWSIRSSVKAATDEQSSYTYTNLGKPDQVLRWFCIARESVPWLCPRQGKRTFSVKEDAILASFLREDGLHVVILAVSLDDVLTVLKSDENGFLIAVARNDQAGFNKSVILVAVGKTLEKANEAVWDHAKELVERDKSLLVKSTVSKSKTIDPTSLESWYDGFAYCTWNGLGQQLTEEKISNALETLSASGIQFSTLIIDDNWQSLDKHGENNFHHRWVEFEADRDTFPNGLKRTISRIRKQHPQIEHIAVWHGIFGYWNGISPDGAIAKSYRTKLLKKSGQGFFGGGSLVAVEPVDVERFYDDFYRFLSDSGIDSVKTDTQFLLDQIDDPIDRASYTAAYQDAWLLASQRHFSSKAISCMSQTPQILFHSQLTRSLPTLMVRNSEDFFPDQSDSHPWHIFCNAHNNFITQHLNVLPDWDMFQTSHDYSDFHAAARCISGGPIYFTDKPGEHNAKLIKEMTSKTIAGKTIILRTNVGKTMNVYSANDEKRLLKVGTTTIERKTSILGVFNINNCAISELISLQDFPNPQRSQSQECIVRAHKSGVIGKTLNIHDFTPQLLLELDVKGYEILTLHPLEEIYVKQEGGCAANFAVLGLLNKMAGAAAVLDVHLAHEEEDSRVNINITLKALGVLGIYFSDKNKMGSAISEIKVCGMQISEDVIEYIPTKGVLKIDVESAWETIRLSQYNCKQLIVEVSIKHQSGV